MKSNANQSSTGHCTGCNGPQHLLNRRRFLAVGSGCVLGALGTAATASATTDKLPIVDIGTLKDFTEDGISEKFTPHDFFVIRYQDRLFAATTTCPHMGNILCRDPQDATRIVCGAHGSVFDAEGMVVVGPATSGLMRLGIVVNSAGHIVVNPKKEFPQDKWTDKGCYIEVK